MAYRGCTPYYKIFCEMHVLKIFFTLVLEFYWLTFSTMCMALAALGSCHMTSS